MEAALALALVLEKRREVEVVASSVFAPELELVLALERKEHM